jgi:hypothetical protein
VARLDSAIEQKAETFETLYALLLDEVHRTCEALRTSRTRSTRRCRASGPRSQPRSTATAPWTADSI